MGNTIKALKHRGITIHRRWKTGGSISFRVECPILWFHRTTFKQFKNKEDAKRLIYSQLYQTAQHGQLANLLSAEQRLDAHSAHERLSELKVSLVECVDFYLKHAEHITGSTGMSELIVGYLEDARKGKGKCNGRPRRNRSLNDRKKRLEKFSVTFASKNSGEVSSLDIESWLNNDEWTLQAKGAPPENV